MIVRKKSFVDVFVGQKCGQQNKKEKQHTNPLVLAREIDLVLVLVRVIKQGTCIYLNLGKKGDLVEFGVSS